jgi:PAS domain S-box-containing protein
MTTKGSAREPGKKPSAISGSSLDFLFRTFVETVSDYAIFALDPEGHVISWNWGAERLKGYTAGEIIGSHFSRFYPPEALERDRPHELLSTAADVGRVEDEGWRVRKDGTRFWANVVITALRDSSGKLIGYVKITRDLTERRRSEERARQAEERFRALIEGVGDYAIFMLDPEGIVTSWNAGAERIKGYTADEIVGRHFSLFYPAEALARGWPQHELEEATRQGRFEDEGWRIRKDGTRFWANVVITAMRRPDGTLRGFSKITRDLSERREYEERLRRSEERFRLLVEGVEDYSICMLDPEGRITSWNAGAQRLTGYTADEIIGTPIERCYPREDALAGRPASELRDALLYRRAQETGWRMRKDGTRFWAEVLTTSVRDPDGRHIGYAQIMRDMSERKRMEAMEEQGRRVTEFLAMLAHELRNPLAPIRNAVSILSLSRDVTPQVAWCREVIERQTTHLSRLVDDLLDVSRVTRGKLHIEGQPMDVNVAVQRAIEAARPLIEKRNHKLEVRLGATPIVVNGDLTRLTQVVLNLLNNAAKYTQEGGTIEVAVGAEGTEAVVTVADNGLGIPPDLLERVFDLFSQGERTLDRSEGGLGIGLTLARRIVMLHGGNIRAESEGVGKGSKFTVRLPQLNLALPAFEPPEVDLPHTVHRRSILVVDDNADSAASIAMFLQMLGHEVATAASGNDALHYIERERPEIILLDIGLPGIDGYEVARRVREKPEGQGVRLYALTGYGQEEDRRRSALAGFDGHLVKPVAPAELAQLIEASPAALQA